MKIHKALRPMILIFFLCLCTMISFQTTEIDAQVGPCYKCFQVGLPEFRDLYACWAIGSTGWQTCWEVRTGCIRAFRCQHGV